MANEINVERCDGSVAPKRWKVGFEGFQVGYVEEIIITVIFGKPEYIGLYFCDGPGIRMIPRTFSGPMGQQEAFAAVIESWQANNQASRQANDQRDADSFIGWKTV